MSEAIDWKARAETVLLNEAETKPFHRPPSSGILLQWRDRTLVGMIQGPISELYPLITFVSVTSKYFDPEFVKQIRELDPGRLLMTADSKLDMVGTFHVLRRVGNFVTSMTPEEARFIAKNLPQVVQVQPSDCGIDFIPISTPTDIQ